MMIFLTRLMCLTAYAILLSGATAKAWQSSSIVRRGFSSAEAGAGRSVIGVIPVAIAATKATNDRNWIFLALTGPHPCAVSFVSAEALRAVVSALIQIPGPSDDNMCGQSNSPAGTSCPSLCPLCRGHIDSFCRIRDFASILSAHFLDAAEQAPRWFPANPAPPRRTPCRAHSILAQATSIRRPARARGILPAAPGSRKHLSRRG